MNKPVVKIALLVVLVVFVAGMVAVGAVYVMTRKPVVKQAEPPKRALYSAGDFTTNLAPDGGKTRFIKVKVELEIADEKGLEELTRQHAVIRDQILSVLRSKNAEDVSEETGMAALGRHLANRLNGVLKGVEITGVYFTDFVVQ